jgi:hypothetical protein
MVRTHVSRAVKNWKTVPVVVGAATGLPRMLYEPA